MRHCRSGAIARLLPWAAVLTGLAVLLAGGRNVQAASFQVSPSRYEFSLDKRFTEFFTVTNTSTDNVRIRIYPRFVELDADNKLQEGVESPYDLSASVVINPRQVSLRPQQRRVVRFSVRPPPQEGLQDGEYRTVIFFEELPPPRKVEATPEAESGEVRLDLTLLTRLGVPLYGFHGERTAAATFDVDRVGAESGQIVVSGRFHNTGNAHLPLDVTVTVLDEDDEEAARHEERVFLNRGQTRNWSYSFAPEAAGAYRLSIVGTVDETQVVEASLAVTATESDGG